MTWLALSRIIPLITSVPTAQKEKKDSNEDNPNNQGALKGTELRWQREPKTQIFAENRRFSQIHPFSWKFKHLKGAGNRRKPQIFTGNRRKPQIGLRHLRSVTFSSSQNKVQESLKGMVHQGIVWVCAPLCCQNLHPGFLQGWWGSCGQQIQANVEGPMQQTLVQAQCCPLIFLQLGFGQKPRKNDQNTRILWYF